MTVIVSAAPIGSARLNAPISLPGGNYAPAYLRIGLTRTFARVAFLPGGQMSRAAFCFCALTCGALLSVTACVHSQASEADVAATTMGSRELITEDEIASVSAQSESAYDIIKRLRANFLSYRGETSFYNTSSPVPTVYVDDQLYGPLSILSTIPAQQVASIRLYRAWEATTKYGTGNMGGVISIYTRR